MTIEVMAVGGYGEVGKNMTAIKIDDDVIIIDMGLHMPNYIKYTEGEEEKEKFRADDLMKVQAIPDIALIENWKSKVRAIVLGHAHLDHIGAVPYLANKFRAPILGTPYTMAVTKAILRDMKTNISNPLKTVPVNGNYRINQNLSIEFINVPHSVPHSGHIAIHTKYGIILYALDFKFDNTPVVGDKPNYNALKRIGDKGVVLAFVDSLYAHEEKKTPSESVVKEMLRDVLLSTNSKGNAIIVTTFASHIARLKTIIEFGRQLNRKVVFLGRSLAKYTDAAESIKLVNFTKDLAMFGKYGKQNQKILNKINRDGVHKYLLVVTGHQGEPKSTLSKMARGLLPFKFRPGDHVIFSSSTIPHPTNIADRQRLDAELRSYGVRIFKDIHVSGHPCREDLYEFFRLVKPKHVIPAHSEHGRMEAFMDFAETLGFRRGESVHELFTGQRFVCKHR
jgi:ribonuclease J